jgi:uncharacterized protein YprB with RNaseH-like and TPR domain
MTKKELQAEYKKHQDRMGFRCIHGHTGYSHPNCYDKEKGLVNRIGFLDIESCDLLADWGFALSYCIKELGGKVLKGLLTPEEVRNPKVRDKNLLKQFCKDLEKFDTLVVYYGKDTGGRFQRHDIPFMRTRAIKWRLTNFPKEKEKKIVDVYDVVKAKLKLKRNTMQQACTHCGIPSKTTPHDWEVWQRARDGNQAALNKVLRHNVEDVVALEKLWEVVYPYKRVKVLI